MSNYLSDEDYIKINKKSMRDDIVKRVGLEFTNYCVNRISPDGKPSILLYALIYGITKKVRDRRKILRALGIA